MIAQDGQYYQSERVSITRDGKAILKNRIIGHFKDQVFYTTRKKESQIFRKMDAIGFNWDLIQRCKYTKYVAVTLPDETEVYITIQRLKSYKPMRFKGHELQIFVPRKDFVKDIKELEQYN